LVTIKNTRALADVQQTPQKERVFDEVKKATKSRDTVATHVDRT